MDQTLSASEESAPVYLNTKETRTLDVDPSVFSTQIVLKTVLAFATNAKIPVQELVGKMLPVMFIITFLCALVLQECQEMLSLIANL